jgi:hypothetical protein
VALALGRRGHFFAHSGRQRPRVWLQIAPATGAAYAIDLASWLGSLGPGGGWLFVPPLARQFLLSFEAFRRPLVQDCCPMLRLFFRPRFDRGLGPVRVDPGDIPS